MKTAILVNISGIGDVVSSLIVANPLSSSYNITYVITNPYKGLLESTGFTERTSSDKINQEFDLLIDLTSNSKSREICKRIRAKEKIGRYKNLWGFIKYFYVYTKQVNRFSRPSHIVHDFDPILEYINLEKPEKTILETTIIKDKIPNFISIHIGSRNQLRRIPTKLIIEICEYFKSNNQKVRLIGSEKELIKTIMEETNNYPLYEEGTVAEVKVWLLHSKIVIGSDSGIVHLASSLNIPCIGLYGPTVSRRYGNINSNTTFIELDYNCRPCTRNKRCPYDNKCMNDISFTNIQNEIEKILIKKD